MKVLFIAPPFYRLIGLYNRYFPYGLLAVATAVRGASHEVRVHDADFNETPSGADYYGMADLYPEYLAALRAETHPAWGEIDRLTREYAPDVVGVQAYTDFFASALKTAEICRRAAPRAKIVLGGPHVRFRRDEVFELCPEADFLVRGEGELALLALLSSLEQGGAGLDAIAGVSWRQGGEWVHNPDRLPARECLDRGGPDRGLLSRDGQYTSEDMGLVMTSRGCPYNCGFCATETRQVRYRPLEDVVDEIRTVRKRYGTVQFAVKDDSFAVNKRRVAEFCEMLRAEKLRINWECNTRVNVVDGELLESMRRSGCNFVKVGIESGSDRVLQSMNKRITVAEILRAAGLLRRSGIHWTGYFMMGLPGETAEDVAATLDILAQTSPHVAVLGVYQPYPGTALFEEGVRRGLVKPAMTREDFFSTMPCHYYKKDSAIQTDTMAPEAFRKLEARVKAVFHRHNRQLGRAAKMGAARAKLYLREPKTLFSDLKKFSKYRGGRTL